MRVFNRDWLGAGMYRRAHFRRGTTSKSAQLPETKPEKPPVDPLGDEFFAGIEWQWFLLAWLRNNRFYSACAIDEEAKYNYDKPGYADATGHFRQMVWKGTTQLGCAQAFCNPLSFPNSLLDILA
ncbi:hypothetical protein JCM10296v2_002989 [Rhodotorula toruloides]